jgi:predicted DNA-binding protein
MVRKATLNWCIPRDLKERLYARSELTGAPVAEILRRAVERYLDEAPPLEELPCRVPMSNGRWTSCGPEGHAVPRKATLNWSLPRELKGRLVARSAVTGAPVSEIVRRAVERYLGEVPPREEPRPSAIDPADQPRVMGRIAGHLRAAGCTQRRLSLRLGMDQSAYSQWKHNHRRIPPARLQQIASILDIPLASLLDPEPPTG